MKPQRLNAVVVYVWLALLIYFFVAQMIFAYRHPWYTEIERLLHTWDALCLR